MMPLKEIWEMPVMTENIILERQQKSSWIMRMKIRIGLPQLNFQFQFY